MAVTNEIRQSYTHAICKQIMACASVRDFVHAVENILGRHCKSKWKQIIADLFVVSVGLKPVFLFDYSCVAPYNVQNLVHRLCELKILHYRPTVCSLGEDVLVVNKKTLKMWLRKYQNEPTLLKIIDCSPNKCHPILLDGDRYEFVIKKHFKMLSDTFNLSLNENELDEKLLTPVNLPITDDINVPALFGIMLGYPTVYYFDENSQNFWQNCLDQIPLCVNKIVADIKIERSAESAEQNSKKTLETGDSFAIVLNQHVLYQYSYPVPLEGEIKQSVSFWNEELCNSLSADKLAGTFSNIRVDSFIKCLHNPSL